MTSLEKAQARGNVRLAAALKRTLPTKWKSFLAIVAWTEREIYGALDPVKWRNRREHRAYRAMDALSARARLAAHAQLIRALSDYDGMSPLQIAVRRLSNELYRRDFGAKAVL